MKTFFLPANVPSSKNNKQWTGTLLINSERVMKWKEDTKYYWELIKDSFLKSIEDLEKPYHIGFTFVRENRHKFDYINPLQTVLDEMVDYGWLEDDNMTIIKPFFGNFKYDKDNPGVYIHIIKTTKDYGYFSK